MVSAERYAIVVATFYEEVAARLITGAQRAITESGNEAADVFEVPGAYELPQAALYVSESGRYNGVVSLGCVVRGETDHYDYVCDHATRGLGEVGLRTGVPGGFGVITADTIEQAVVRSGAEYRDSGYDAAKAVLRLAEIRKTNTSR